MKKEKLKEGTEVIYTDNNTIMEKVTVISVDKKAGSAVLSNRVKVSRLLGPDDTFHRVDGKGDQKAWPINEKTEKIFQAYKAYFHTKRIIEKLYCKVTDMKSWDADFLIKVNGKLSKVVKLIEEGK